MCGLGEIKNIWIKSMVESIMNVNPRDKACVITPLDGVNKSVERIKIKLATKKEYLSLPFSVSDTTCAVCDGFYELLFNITSLGSV